MPQTNHAAPLAPWRPGRPLTRRRINQLVEHANALGSITGGPGIEVTRTSRGVSIALGNPAAVIPQAGTFAARITGSSNGAHAWEEVMPSAGSYIGKTGGRSGSTSADPAYEANGRANVPANTIVTMIAATGNDGSTQYTFDLGSGDAGTPASMAYSGEHGENPSAATWDIENQGSDRGLNITLQTGQRYDHAAATPTLYAYLRTLSFNAAGQLVAVSAESRVTIDTPESCP